MSGEERSARVARNARAALMRNLAGVLISLAMVPLALRALGTEGYGTFQILVSLGNLAAMTDIGIGLALLTRVGQLAGAQQQDQIRHVVGGALMVISMVVVVTAAVALAALQIVDVPRFLKVPAALHQQARNGLFVVLAAFVVRMPLSVFSSAHAGLQISDRLVWWNVGASMAASIAMVAAATVTRRLDIAIAVQLALSLAGTVCAVRLGCQIAPTTRPAFSSRDLAVGWNLMRSGLVYYVLQLEVAIIGSIDNLVIAKVLGVQSVALYSVAQRLISVAFSMVYSLGASFWGGVSHAVGTGDISWIRSEATRLRQLGSLWMAVIAGGFAAVGVPFINLWTGHRLLIDPWLPVALGVYFACLGHTMIDASILNGAEKIRQQVVTVGFDAALNLGLSVWLARHIGYVGVGAGTAVAYLACTFLPLQIFSWRLVVKGPRPPFWTRSLTTAMLAIGTGFLLDRFLTHTLGWGNLVRLLAGGVASLLLTLLFIRTIVGRGGIDVLIRTFRRTQTLQPGAGGHPA